MGSGRRTAGEGNAVDERTPAVQRIHRPSREKAAPVCVSWPTPSCLSPGSHAVQQAISTYSTWVSTIIFEYCIGKPLYNHAAVYSFF